jgi:hypothetical protein
MRTKEQTRDDCQQLEDLIRSMTYQLQPSRLGACEERSVGSGYEGPCDTRPEQVNGCATMRLFEVKRGLGRAPDSIPQRSNVASLGAHRDRD